MAATTGLLLAGAALALCSAGNRAVAALVAHHAEWQEARVAAALWAAEWRGAGYDPAGTSGAAVSRLSPDTMEFAADWNGNGALQPTDANPNERLAYAAAPGAWRRGVNGGPRLPIARIEAPRFAFRDDGGRELPAEPDPGAARLAEARLRLAGMSPDTGLRVTFLAARRNGP